MSGLDFATLEPPHRDWRELLERARDPEQRQAMTVGQLRVVEDLESGRCKLPRGQPQSWRTIQRMQYLAEIVAFHQANGEYYAAAVAFAAEANGLKPHNVEKAIRGFKKRAGAARWNRIKARWRRVVAEYKAEHAD